MKAKKPPERIERKVIHTETTRLLSLGMIIPPKWGYVRIEVKKRRKNSVVLKITKLLSVNQLAPNEEADKGDKQDT